MNKRKKNILIAQVGTSNLQNTKYSSKVDLDNGQEDCIETKYSFEAIIREIKKRRKSIDYLLLIGTIESRYKDIFDYYSQKMKQDDSHVVWQDSSITVNKEEKEQLLSKVIGTSLGIPALEVRIAVTGYGVNTDELNDNFDILRETMGKVIDHAKSVNQFEVYFDISNGFRSIPIYIYTMINYLVRVREEEFTLHMYYGMFEAKKKYYDVAPLVDLSHINELMEWINAANEFQNYGSVKELVKIFSKEKNHWQDSLNLKTLFQRFDYASNANNLSVLQETIEQIANLNDGNMRNAKIPYYAKELLQAIGEEFRKEFLQDDRNPDLCNYGEGKYYSYAYLTLHLAKWYMKQGRIGNASVALQEGVTTFVMERWPEESNILIQKNRKNPDDYKDKIAWIANYDNRKAINALFLLNDFNEHLILDSRENTAELNELSICEKMNIIRVLIRNPEAHILLKNDITEEHINKSHIVLESLINFMIAMVGQDAENEKELYRILFEKVEDNLKEIERKERKFRWKTYLEYIKDHNYCLPEYFDEKDIQWKKCFEIFGKELKFLESCRIYSNAKEQEMISRLKKKENTMKYIPKLLLTQYSGSLPLDYKKILRRGYPNRRFGDERLLGMLITNAQILYDLFVTDNKRG